MTTRTITTTLKRANDTAWAGAVITAALRTRFITSGGITPPDVVAVTTDASGIASLVLAVPDAGTAEYYVTLPNGGGGSIYVAAGATITLGALLASSAPVSISAIAEHAALVASGSVLGHVKIGSGITVAADGTISAAGGGGGGGSSPIATPTLAGTVKIATAAADPIVYRSADVDTLLLSYLLSSSYTWSTLPGKPSTFAPTSHAASHTSGGGDALTLAQSQITSLVSDLAAKAAATDLAAHAALATTAHGGIVASSDTRLTDARTPTSHSHAAGDITSGTLNAARMPALGYSIPIRARAATNEAWTAMPAALTEFYGSSSGRTAADLTDAREARIVARVSTAGAATAELRLQYSTNSGASWNYADGVGGPMASAASIGTVRGAWVALAAGAKADVELRIAGINGDGVAAPSFGTVTIQVR